MCGGIALVQEADDVLFVAGRIAAKGRGMPGPFHDPKFLRAARRAIDAFGMAARNRVICRAADQQHRKGTRRDGFFRRDIDSKRIKITAMYASLRMGL
jgi:hypothetical protein